MSKTKIEWTEATWNPIVGCSLASPGCTNCYAMRQAHRMASNPATPQYHGTTKVVKDKPVWTGKMALAEKVLMQPLKRRKPTTYFVNSMGDLFHEDVPDDWIDRVFAVMALCPQHTFQVLTKRSERMREYVTMADFGEADRWIRPLLTIMNDARTGSKFVNEKWPLSNVWLGVSVEDQRRANERIPDLLATPAAIRFLSCEPLLGQVKLPRVDFHCDLCGGTGILARWPKGQCHHCNGRGDIPAISTDPKFGMPSTPMRTIDWVIAGGESGPGARPMHPDWARSLRDQCAAARVPFHFKQWGDWHIRDGEFERVGKKAAGRALDGVIHDGFPEVA